jgi:hypothetical protein
MAQMVRAGSVLEPSVTKCTLLRQHSQVPPPELVRACYKGDEATVLRYLQGAFLNLDYKLSQMLRDALHRLTVFCCAVCKSLFFGQRRTHSSLVYVHEALFLPWHDMANSR